MIGKLTGLIAKTNRTPIIIDVGGVGYLVHITEKLLGKLTADTSSSLYIHTHVRDDALDLYGFFEEKELSLFELLLTVSGVGPKTALGVMEKGAAFIEKAVKQSDVDFFTGIPRLGKKNAQKIIIELKNKLGGLYDLNLKDDNGETKQLKEALLSMGFTNNEIASTIDKVSDSEDSLEQKIKNALKLLAKRT